MKNKFGDFIPLGAKVVSSSYESFRDNKWIKSKRKELQEKGIPEFILQIQDYIQININSNENVVYHRKFMVVDGKESWIGSVNIGDEYIYDTPLTVDSASNTSVPSNNSQWHDGIPILWNVIFLNYSKGLLHVFGNSLAQQLNIIFAAQWMVLGGDVFDFQSSKYNPIQGFLFSFLNEKYRWITCWRWWMCVNDQLSWKSN